MSLRCYVTMETTYTLKVKMNEAYENLKVYFSSQNCSTNCNLPHLVIFAEHAVKEKNLTIAADCLRMYFSHNSPRNQFYIRAHLCEALITAPTDLVNKVGLTECLNSIVKAIDIAREFECYHFLIYNCSVVLWQICRPYQHPGLCRLYAKPLQYVVRALEESKDQDWKWRLELLLGLVHSQVDAGYKEDAARTCLNAINLARKRSPSQLVEVLKIQMYYNLGEAKKDAVLSSELSALCQLHKTKGIAHQQDLTSTELEQKLRKLSTIVTGTGGLNSPATTPLKDTRMPFLLELGMFCVEHHLTELAQECLAAVPTASISHDAKVTLIKESLIYQLTIAQSEKANNRSTADTTLKLLLRITDLVTASKKTLDFNLVQYVCVVLWNLSLPLLQKSSCHLLLKPLNAVANVLKEISSTLFQLRANVHFEIAKIFVTDMDLKSGLKHVQEALALDILREHSEHWMFFEKQLTLRAQLYTTPSNLLDQAMTSVKCASIVHSVEELRPLLIKAGEMLAPNFFTDALRSKETNVRDYEQQKNQFREFMTTTGNDNDKDRCLTLVDMVKTAYRSHIWDIASVACQLCLYYDDGRWKASKALTKSRSPYGTSLDSMISHSDSREEHEVCGKFTTEMLRLLAEVHCIFAQCLMNRLQQGVDHSPSCSTHESVDSSTQYNQTEWVSVVSDDIVKALLRSAELGCALGEPWLVYNASCSLWNYSHDWVDISEGHLITTFRQLLPFIKQIDLGSDSVLGILVCTALSVGLIDKWTHAKPESSTRASTAAKKNGQHTNKKGKDVHSSEQVHIDPEGCLEIKEALEVCEYAMVTYTDVPLSRRRKLLEIWVKCKLLQQQSIPIRTYGIGEGRDFLNCRAIIAVEMADFVCKKGLNVPNCPTPYDILVLLTDCQWRDTQLEMELWIKVATTAIAQNDYELILLCCKSVAKIHANTSRNPDCSTEENLLLSMSNYFNGLGLSATAAGNFALLSKALDYLLISARFGCSSGSYSLVMNACSHYWNTCLPLAASSFGRELLCDPVLELLSLVATFLGRGKHEPSMKDQDTLLAMYGLVFQALSDKRKWELGLKIVEEATLTLPKATSHHLIKHKLMFKSRMGKSVEGDIMIFSEQPKAVLASLWYQTAKHACDQTGGLRAYRNAIQLLQSDDCSWQKVQYLVKFSEWLHQHQFSPQVSLDHLQNVVDVILTVDSSTGSTAANSLSIHQLEVLMRVHVMMSLLHRQGSCSHKQLTIAAVGFCFQMWKVIYDLVTNNGTSKDLGPKLPSTIAEWVLFEVPQEVINRMQTESHNSKGKNSFIENPMLSLHYLGVLAKTLSEAELEALALPVLRLQFVIANSLEESNEPICRLIHMRTAILCAELGLPSVHSDALHSMIPSIKHLASSHMEIQQYNNKKIVVERTISKHSDMESEHSPGKIWSIFPDKQLQAKYECKKIIKDSTVLREICVQQAVILISQGEYQCAHELLDHTLISCQIFADSGTLFLVFCGLAILSLIENKRSKAVHYLIASQNLSRNIEHWMDGISMFSDYLTTDRGAVHSSLLEFIITSVKDKVTDSVTADCGTAILAHRLNLLMRRSVTSSHSGAQSLQCCDAHSDASDWFLKQDYYIEAAQILHQQAKHARSIAGDFPLHVQTYQHYLLQALKLYEKSIALLSSAYESVRLFCQPSKKISLHIQRDVIHAMLGSAEVLLTIYEKDSDLKMLNNHDCRVESVIKGYIDEVSIPTLLEEEWKTTALSAVEKALSILSAAYLLSQGDTSLEARCAYGFGCCFYLFSRHFSPLWKFHGRDEQKIQINEAITVHFLLQASNSLSEALSLALKSYTWILGASIAMKIVDCSNVCDPATSSLYLMLYQSFTAAMELKKVVTTVHPDPSASQLGALLEQQERFSRVKFCPGLQANIEQLNNYEVFRRLQISENHLEILKMFPANFRFVLLLHSVDRSQLLSAYLIPPQSQLSVTKKGQAQQQTESCEPTVSFTDVSIEDFNQLQELIADSSNQGSSVKFVSILSAMEQYFANALKTAAVGLRSEIEDKDITIIILGDSDLLALPLESMTIFQQNHITSVSRDFSLQMLHYRMLIFNVNEEAVNVKDKKKSDKPQSQSTVVADASHFKYILDPKNDSSWCVELRDAIGGLANIMQSCTRVTSKWSGYSSPKSRMSLNEWSLLFKNASGILYFGTERLLSHYPATLLTSLNLQKCHVMFVVDNVLTVSKESSNMESAIESPTVLSLVLSLAGTSCVVTNQSFTSIKSNSSNVNNVIQGLLADGSTTAQANWTVLKNKHMEVHSSVEGNQEEFSNASETHVQENNCEESNKEHDCNTPMIVYGLPHLVLSN